jgi:hypothetical protein
MRWPARVIASGRRKSAERAYLQARLHAARRPTTQPASWWGFCAALSSHQMNRGTLRPVPNLWTELLPFLRIRDEEVAARAVEEYLLYLENPELADKQWLGIQINDALEGVESFDDSIGALLECPEEVYGAKWMALLSYETLLHLRRAVELYDGQAPHPGRVRFWHGLPVDDAPVEVASRPCELVGAVHKEGAGCCSRRPLQPVLVDSD